MSKTEKYISVPEIVRAFPLLNEREFRLLGFCAFYGSYPPNPWTVTMYDTKFGLPKNRSDKDRKTLREKGFLGVFSGEFTAASAGLGAAVLAGLIVSLLGRPKDKGEP